MSANYYYYYCQPFYRRRQKKQRERLHENSVNKQETTTITQVGTYTQSPTIDVTTARRVSDIFRCPGCFYRLNTDKHKGKKFISCPMCHALVMLPESVSNSFNEG